MKDVRGKLLEQAVNEVRELIKLDITRKAEAKKKLMIPSAKKFCLFITLIEGEVHGIVIRGNYSTRDEIVRNHMDRDVTREIWEWIPSYVHRMGFAVKIPDKYTYILYDGNGDLP